MRRSRIRSISAKRKRQLLLENELKAKLYKKQDGMCGCGCKRKLETDWAGWDKHELVSRARGGDPLDENNCDLRRRQCHMKKHGINVKEV